MRQVALLLLLYTVVRDMGHCYEVEVPENYTALSGDLVVLIRNFKWEPGAQLELLHLEYVQKAQSESPGNSTSAVVSSSWKWTVLGSLPVTASPKTDKTVLAFPCGVIASGGQYGVRLSGISEAYNNLTRRGKQPSWTQIGNESNIIGLDVRWPPCMITASPREIETYPTVQVTALLQFLPTTCSPAMGATPPETWLDLMSCGSSLTGCTDANRTHGQVVYSEQIRGYPKRRSVVLRCELFGIAGHYALVLRPSLHSNIIIPTQNQESSIKAVWSEQYIFNVRERSIFPCDVHGGGVAVLFQYPQCILQGDRVRLYSHLRADVSALTAPTTSTYVAEHRVIKGKHSLQFECDLFLEKFVEYCFVYVSKAITGAVSNVRVDCVPTLPVSDGDSGGWSAWTEWTACTTTCGSGTRSRFRFCDSPPPRYGASFCKGEMTQTERCGNSDWDCEFTNPESLSSLGLPAERPDVQAEVGPGCRCGCVVYLNAAKPRRLLATSSQSCPGRALWVIQADSDHVIRLSMEYYRFPCRSQWLKIRDGDSLADTLIAEISLMHVSETPITSKGPLLLLEFFSDALLTGGAECSGGFVAHARQTPRNVSAAPAISSGFSISSILRNVEVAPSAAGLGIVHGVVALFLTALFLMTGCLGVQYAHRYRKYQLAAAAEDQDSLTAGSQGSLAPVRSRATSNSTLLSEVISMRRFAPRKCRHSRLREVDPELDEGANDSSDSQRDDGDMEEPPKSPTGSQQTLKALSTEDGSAATPTPSPDAMRRSLNGASEKAGMVDEAGNSSSLDSTTSRGSSIARLLLQRRQSISSASTRSASTLTQGCDSNSSSLRSNPKEKKERRNRERLLAGSEFSLTGEADLEMDYYDYNVHNAAAVPESYIGMDPAYLIWIPPVSPAGWDEENDMDDSESSHEKETLDTIEENKEISTVKLQNENEKTNNRLVAEVQVHGRSSRVRLKKVSPCNDRARTMPEEKETAVEKSPSGNSVYYESSEDIKFADDDEDDCRVENTVV